MLSYAEDFGLKIDGGEPMFDIFLVWCCNGGRVNGNLNVLRIHVDIYKYIYLEDRFDVEYTEIDENISGFQRTITSEYSKHR